jgi:hypothetical protein
VEAEGTALLHVTRVPELAFPGVSESVHGNDFPVVTGTCAPVVFPVHFPLGILVPGERVTRGTASPSTSADRLRNHRGSRAPREAEREASLEQWTEKS